MIGATRGRGSRDRIRASCPMSVPGRSAGGAASDEPRPVTTTRTGRTGSMPTNTPTGAVREVGVDEIFFSTTDAKGVIERSNDVFVRLSRSEREQLIEVPHNLVRHPEMPDGAFHAMWATLQKGQPFAVYVRNLAANGSVIISSPFA